jgi:hypothetical protein
MPVAATTATIAAPNAAKARIRFTLTPLCLRMACRASTIPAARAAVGRQMVETACRFLGYSEDLQNGHDWLLK